jgi:dipeptidyl aminopeptidase/acylaminoacyl peptidase
MFLRRALLCTLLLSTQPVFAAPTVPLAAFVHEDEYSNPRLSPDGKHIAITVRVPLNDRFVPVVMMFSLPEMKQVGALRLPVFEVPVDYQWISAKRLVLSKGKEFGSREKPQATGELLAFDLDGTHQEYLFGYQMRNFASRGERYGNDWAFGYVEDVSMKRDGHLFVTSRSWEDKITQLYDVDGTKSSRSLLAELPVSDLTFILQRNGKPRFAIGADESTNAVEFRFDDATGKWGRIEKNTGRRYRPYLFSADDSAFVATYSEHGEPDQLIREDLATGKRAVLFSDPVGSYEAMFDSARQPFAAYARVGIPKMHYFDAKDPASVLHQQLSANFPGQHVSFINFSDDGKLLLFGVRSDRDPGSFYLFNRTTMKADLLFSSMEAIDPAKMAERRPISVKTRDGHMLHGFVTMPAHPAGVKVPLVVLPHGGPHGIEDDWFFDEDAQFLASRGYAVLQLNFRGSGGRGVNFLTAGYREWAGKIIDDLDDATKWVIAQGNVDGNRVCAYGASFGAYASMMLAARDSTLYKCAVGYVGAYDLNLLGKPKGNIGDKYLANAFRKYIGDDRAVLDRNSPINLADRIKSPVFLVHGGIDKTTPVEHAEAMRKALIAAGRPPEWFLAPNEGHGFYDTANRTAFYEKLEAFLGKHIGDKAGTAQVGAAPAANAP